ncbi:excinuclease ABC subunit UvrC [Oceanithermus sp.]|uniref:excinuclease ABC subunit UvrC n=1 Tax=Oceanithermus sp. TaxID=2268145 RepID=UPI0025DE08CE|nr:excinuclease ABC subunit UvrC [Oceanithermus sp.]
MTARDLPRLPARPGVYLWKRGGRVIYVGKAKNLRSRVNHYAHGEDKAGRIFAEADGLEFIVTRDEVEALLLEANLIKAHRPEFNVLMKDDKHYPFLKLTNEAFPALVVTRRVEADGARYWGPFPDAGAVRRIKRLVDRVFPLRKNSGVPMKKKRRPCLNYAMGRCLAPCVGRADSEEYARVVRRVERLLDGRVDDLLEELAARMEEAARAQHFELAAELRDQIRALERFFASSQQAYAVGLGDVDVVGLARSGPYAMVQLFQIRGGRMLGRTSRFVENAGEASDTEVLEAFLRDYYLVASPLPPLVLLPLATEGQEVFARVLAERAGRRVELRVPKRGEKVRLVQFASENARAGLEVELARLEKRGDHPALASLQRALGLSRRPWRIEGYDVSNLFGTAVVAAIAVFEGGKPRKSQYRRMRIRGLAGKPDDYKAMEEAVYRRFTGSLQAKMESPDLLLIDGGLGQVRAAQKALERAGVSLPLVGLAKREEVLVLPSGERVMLPLDDPGLRLLIHLRDETHRFGLAYNRQLRGKKTLKSVFDDVPGIGPARKKALLERYSTLDEIRAASLEELAALPGMNRRAAEAVMRHLQGADASA